MHTSEAGLRRGSSNHIDTADPHGPKRQQRFLGPVSPITGELIYGKSRYRFGYTGFTTSPASIVARVVCCPPQDAASGLSSVSSLPIMEKGEQFLKVIEIFALLCSHYKM